MLDELDSVPWSKLTHAYGAAKDVPQLIRDLGSAEKHEQALWALCGNIFHQGTRYQATPYAVPFLLELVQSGSTPVRHEVIYLLVALALGYDESYLPDGLDSTAFREKLNRMESEMSDSQRERCAKYGFGPAIEVACYDAVRQCVPVFIALLGDSDVLVRFAAAYALAWFPEDAAVSAPAIRGALLNASDDLEIANAMLAMGLLGRTSKLSADLSEFSYLLGSDSPAISTAAAIALAGESPDEQVIDVLIEALSATREVPSLRERVRFNGGDIGGYAGLVLSRIASGSARARVVAALCDALKASNEYQSLDLTRALLDLTLSERTAPIKDSPVHSLDPLLLAALRSIAEYGGWKMGEATFANYSELARAYGLPDSQEALRSFLEPARE